MLALLWLGLLLGIRHAADPDHVVAIGTIAARTDRLLPAVRLGIVWGLGHTLTLFIVASGIIMFEWVVPPRLGLSMEFCVAVALVVLGIVNLRHTHRREGARVTRGPMQAFVVGLVHGLAGSAAVALLVLTTVPDPRWASVYLLTFGVGTLVGMTLITTGIAFPIAGAASRWRHGGGSLRVVSGAFSIAMGAWLAYQLGWHDGLFLSAATWTPR